MVYFKTNRYEKIKNAVRLSSHEDNCHGSEYGCFWKDTQSILTVPKRDLFTANFLCQSIQREAPCINLAVEIWMFYILKETSESQQYSLCVSFSVSAFSRLLTFLIKYTLNRINVQLFFYDNFVYMLSKLFNFTETASHIYLEW